MGTALEEGESKELHKEEGVGVGGVGGAKRIFKSWFVEAFDLFCYVRKNITTNLLEKLIFNFRVFGFRISYRTFKGQEKKPLIKKMTPFTRLRETTLNFARKIL